VSIKKLDQSERPRERLLAHGAASLSLAELLAILLRNGAAGGSAVVQARELLTAAGGSLRRLASLGVADLSRVRGVGPAKAAEVLACLELAKRFGEEEFVPGATFRNSYDVYAHFRERLADERCEHFYAVLLDNKHRKIRDVRVSQGSLTSSIVHPREVFLPVIRESAAAVIFVHNHPSGDPTPSREDLEITRRLREVGELVGVRVLDHLVIGRGRYVSFVDDGYW
jgi:DNA repair protein RadC